MFQVGSHVRRKNGVQEVGIIEAIRERYGRQELEARVRWLGTRRLWGGGRADRCGYIGLASLAPAPSPERQP